MTRDHSLDSGLGVYPTDAPLVLTPAPNGGWIVSWKSSIPGDADRVIGAFTNAFDMIEVLAFAVTKCTAQVGWLTPKPGADAND